MNRAIDGQRLRRHPWQPRKCVNRVIHTGAKAAFDAQITMLVPHAPFAVVIQPEQLFGDFVPPARDVSIVINARTFRRIHGVKPIDLMTGTVSQRPLFNAVHRHIDLNPGLCPNPFDRRSHALVFRGSRCDGIAIAFPSPQSWPQVQVGIEPIKSLDIRTCNGRVFGRKNPVLLDRIDPFNPVDLRMNPGEINGLA